MKNTEWGAVAYLSHSRFGIDKEININNYYNSTSKECKTGYSAKLTTGQGTYKGEYGAGGNYNSAYNTTIGYLASTTGNISGIYDMAGGVHEYMASYRGGASIPTADAKYFDEYIGTSLEKTYNYRILGDATGEMGPFIDYKDADESTRHHNKWYNDHSFFVDAAQYWFDRGENYEYGILAGQFYFGRYTGNSYDHFESRLVLSPTQ